MHIRSISRLLIAVVLASSAPAVAQQTPLVPEYVPLSDVARRAIEAEWLTPEERADLRVFHGVWDERDLLTPTHEALVALNAWRFDDPALADPSVPAELRAESLFRSGHAEDAIELLKGVDSISAARIRAAAYERMGHHRAAGTAIEKPLRQLQQQKIPDPIRLTEGVRALIIRSRLQGQPARDFQVMLNLLGRVHQELDRLYWPALLVEGQLLADKSHQDEAIEALHHVLRLNPRCSDAWYRLGRLGIARFNFDAAERAAGALRRQNKEHPLAAMLEAELWLVQDHPDIARALLEPVVERLPSLRDAFALLAASAALTYDDDTLRAALARCDELAPGSATQYNVVGRFLSLNRQYGVAAEMLEEAIRRQPSWPPPQLELGLMELQSGRDDRALQVLTRVADLDRFNKRAANSLFLLEEMASYHAIETEHFIIQYKPGIDQVMVDMMPPVLERIHETVATRFGFEPDQKTVIDVMPNHERFAVRITGMPWLHTVAACTGPVIAMEVPREGKKSEHLGLFDWPRVLQHEYTHTITLAQTHNRIPHWLTEAAAVSMELSPRDYDKCRMLARSFKQGTLFDLDEIKWAFVRPKRKGDRSKAYAQGHWMVQYMNQTFGNSAIIRLLNRYFQGDREAEAMPEALGVSRDDFYQGFLAWAADDVVSWGMAPEPSIATLTDEIRRADPELLKILETSRQARLDAIVRRLSGQVGKPAGPSDRGLVSSGWPELVRPPVTIDNLTLDNWLQVHPDHPDLLEMAIRRRLAGYADTDELLIKALERYAVLRPVDPLPHVRLAKIYRAADEHDRAIPHLEALDALEQKTAVYAYTLAGLYREAGDFERALVKATRALHLNPYHAPSRELAAGIALQAGSLETARMHIDALTLIEPDRPQHERRLKAVDRMLEQGNQ